MDKTIITCLVSICLFSAILPGCVAYNDFVNTSDTIIFTPREEGSSKGQVVYSKVDCPYFLVNTILGYAVLRLVSGKMPRAGDMIKGDFESYGGKIIFNSSNGSKIKVLVENFWLSKDRAVEIYYDGCINHVNY